MYNVTERKKKMIVKRYLPRNLTNKDKRRQSSMLRRSSRLYKKGIYYTRKNVASFKTKPSNHILTAKKIYKIENVKPSAELAKKTGCSIAALEKIVSKGQGAYFSSGSRPNQTSQSWGLARLASSITGGKAAAVDYSILEDGCNSKSLALKMAKTARKKYGFGQGSAPKTPLL